MDIDITKVVISTLLHRKLAKTNPRRDLAGVDIGFGDDAYTNELLKNMLNSTQQISP